MPRSPRSRRAKGKTAGGDKSKLESERSLSYTRTPLPPSPQGSPPSSASIAMDYKDIEKAVAGCLGSETFADAIVSKLTEKVRNAVVEALSQSLSDARARIEELSKEVDKLRSELRHSDEKNGDKLDDLEQYQRRNNLRVYGIPETQGENTDGIVIGLLEDKLAINLPLERVERSHRVGRSQPPGDDGKQRPRPIIVKFQSYRDRREVFSKKRELKGTGITIREDLTKRRAEVLRRAIQQYGPRKVWTMDGRIVWETEGGRGTATTLTELKTR